MTNLLKSDPLTVQLASPDRTTIIMHPNEGRKVELWNQTVELNLYVDLDDFIEANNNYELITLNHRNDTDFGAIQIKNDLKKDLGNPKSVKLFRKQKNIFLKRLVP